MTQKTSAPRKTPAASTETVPTGQAMPSAEGIESEMFLDAYMTMQRNAGEFAPGSFTALNNAARAIGVISVPRYMKEAFVFELRMRTQLAVEHSTGMTIPELIQYRQRKAQEAPSDPKRSKSANAASVSALPEVRSQTDGD